MRKRTIKDWCLLDDDGDERSDKAAKADRSNCKMKPSRSNQQFCAQDLTRIGNLITETMSTLQPHRCALCIYLKTRGLLLCAGSPLTDVISKLHFPLYKEISESFTLQSETRLAFTGCQKTCSYVVLALQTLFPTHSCDRLVGHATLTNLNVLLLLLALASRFYFLAHYFQAVNAHNWTVLHMHTVHFTETDCAQFSIINELEMHTNRSHVLSTIRISFDWHHSYFPPSRQNTWSLSSSRSNISCFTNNKQ